jgi:hypothetical protein
VSPREGNAIVDDQGEEDHANKHVLLDIRIKLPVHLSQNIGWGRIPRRLSPQNAPADRHDKDAGTPLRNMALATPVVRHQHEYNRNNHRSLAGRHVDAANLKSVDSRRFGRKQNTLNVARCRSWSSRFFSLAIE